MTRITVDNALGSHLLQFTQSLQLCDETGLVLGRFFPIGTRPDSPDDPDYVFKVLEKHKGSTPDAAKELGISLKKLYDKVKQLADRITVAEPMRLQLQNRIQPLELCDASGSVLGLFVLTFDPSLYLDLEPQISQEEIRRRRQSKEKTYTTAEVIVHLEQL